MSHFCETIKKLNSNHVESTEPVHTLLTYSGSLNSQQTIVSPAYSTTSLSYCADQDNDNLSPFLPTCPIVTTPYMSNSFVKNQCFDELNKLKTKVRIDKNKKVSINSLNDMKTKEDFKINAISGNNRFLELENLTSRSCDISTNFGVLKLLDEIEKKEMNMANESLKVFNNVSIFNECKVCGGDASGFHYGVDSCEGCKGFYRRCLTQGINNICNNNEKCLVTPLSRNNCQFCRFKKCREVGMSKEGSRLGRRPKRLKIPETNLIMKTNKKKHSNLISPSSRRIPSFTEISPSHLSEYIVRTLTKNKKFKFCSDDRTFLKNKNGLYNIISTDKSLNSQDSSNVKNTFKTLNTVFSLNNKNNETNSRVFYDVASDSDIEIKLEKKNEDTLDLEFQGPFSNCSYENSYKFNVKMEPPEIDGCYLTTPTRNTLSNCNQTDFKNTDNVASMSDSSLFNDKLTFFMNEKNYNGSLDIGDELFKNDNELKKNEFKIESVDDDWDDEYVANYKKNQTNFDIYKQPVQSFTKELKDYLDIVKSKSINERELETLEEIVQMIVDAHFKTCIYTLDRIDYKFLNSQIEKSKNNEDCFDPHVVIKMFLDTTASVIQRVVKFSKKIPGFLELCEEDQITLIRLGSFEVILTRFTKMISPDGMFVPDMTIFVPRKVISRMPLGKFFETQFPFAESFNALELTDSEIALFTAILIINPKRLDIQMPETVLVIHRHLVRALFNHMKNNRKENVDELFMRLMAHLPQLQHINTIHSHAVNNIYLAEPDLNFPPLHVEVFNNN